MSAHQDGLRVFTLAMFSRDPAGAIAEIRESGQPGFITEHGRFTALIRALDPGEIEQEVLSQMAAEIASGREAGS